MTGVKQGLVGRGRWFDYIGVAALVLTPITVMVRVLESVKRLPVYSIARLPVSTLLVLAFMVFTSSGPRSASPGRSAGSAKRSIRWCLSESISRWHSGWRSACIVQQQWLSAACHCMSAVPAAGTLPGARGSSTASSIGADLHGLCRPGAGRRPAFLVSWSRVRGRRLYSIARLSIYESNRRMWAPWVVITVFLLVLAFTHWFLQPPRVAEMGRLYVGTLSLLCSVLLTVMVTILTPLSLPTDIQQQTIYTVVSKPVRRLELIWGRMIGYMALVTILVAVFGAISLVYLWRTVGIDDQDDRGSWRSRPGKKAG